MRQQNPITTSLARGASLVLLATMLPLATVAQNQAPQHDPAGAAKRFKQTHSWPDSQINWDAYDAAKAQSARMAPAFGAQSAPGSGISIMALKPSNPSPPKTPVWSYIGPNNSAGEAAPVSGRAMAAAYDTKNPQVYYVATSSGGVFRTTDSGKTWTSLSKADQYGRSFSSVTVDPTNSNIVYAGSGDYDNPGSYPGSFGFGIIKFVFSGNDYTTTQLGLVNFGRHIIRKIVVDPRNNQHLMVAVGRDQDPFTIQLWATGIDFLPPPPPPALPPNIPAPNGGIYDSVNGGVSFPKSFTGQAYFSNIVYAANPPGTPANQQVLYASSDFGGVYKSINNGGAWALQGSLPEARWFVPSEAEILDRLNNLSFNSPTYRVDVAPSLIDVNTAYVAVEATRTIYKTTDGGASWTSISNSLPTTLSNGMDIWSFPWYTFHLECSKQTTFPSGSKINGITKDCVYFGTLDLYQSFDGTDNWAAIGNVYTSSARIHTDQHGLTVNPNNPNDMLVLNDGGVYHFIFSPPIQDFKFFSLNAHLPSMQLYFGSYGYIDATQAFVATQDNSHPHADGDLANWLNPGNSDGSWTGLNPLAPGVQYFATQGGGGIPVTFTEDDWKLTRADAPVPADGAVSFIPPIVMDPLNPDILYAGEQHVFQGIHVAGTPFQPGPPPVAPVIGTLTWTQFGADLTDNTPDFTGDFINALCVSPFDNQWLYAGTLHGWLWYKSNNSDWARIDQHIIDLNATPPKIAKLLPDRPIGAIAASNTNPKRIYVGLQGNSTPSRLYMCNDVTVKDVNLNPNVKFVSISGSAGPGHLPDVAINSIVVMPYDDEKTIFVANDLGVYMTTNGGASWTNAGSALGLPANIDITNLTFMPSTGYLYAATYGRGVWSMYVGNTTSFKLYPALQSYRGARSKLTTLVRFYHAGEPVIPVPAVPPLVGPVPTPTEQKTLKLDASGWLLPNVSIRGNFDLWFKVDGFLSKRMKSISVGNTSPVSDLVYAGDVNPTVDPITGLPTIGDNILNKFDLNAILLHLGQFWNGPEDVDGDGIVTMRDYNLVQSNIATGHILGDP